MTKQRDLSVQLLAKAIAERKHKHPAILTGDLIACEGKPSMTYLFGEGGSFIAMEDTYRQLHQDDVVGTFHGFGRTESCKIDYVYVLGELKTLWSTVIREYGEFASDHRAVSARLRF